MGELEATGALADGAGEGALLVAEQFGFEHALGQRRAIELDERLALARREIVHGAREQFLAGAAFSAQQHRRIRFGDDLDRLQHFADRRAFADDAVDLGRGAAARFVQSLVERLFKGSLLVEEALALGRQHAMQAHRLSDEVGDHAKKMQIVVEAARPLAVPDAIDRQGSNHALVALDRHAEKRNAAIETARDEVGRLAEQRVLGHVLDHHRRRRGDQPVDDDARQGLDRLALGLARPSRGRDDFRFAVCVENDDHAEPHVEKAAQHIDDIGERLLEARRAAENLRYFVNARQRDFGRRVMLARRRRCGVRRWALDDRHFSLHDAPRSSREGAYRSI